MNRDKSSDDDVAARRLRLLVSLVVVLALGAIAWSVTAAATGAKPTESETLALVGLVAAIVVGSRAPRGAGCAAGRAVAGRRGP